jgi:hypothetical protein
MIREYAMYYSIYSVSLVQYIVDMSMFTCAPIELVINLLALSTSPVISCLYVYSLAYLMI